MVLAAVAEDGRALEYTSNALQDDQEVVLTAVVQNERAFRYASGVLRDDPEFVLAAVARNGCALRYVSNTFRDDRAVVLAAVAQNGTALGYASGVLRDDPEFVLAAVAHNSKALQYASRRLKEGVLVSYVQDVLAFSAFVTGNRNKHQSEVGSSRACSIDLVKKRISDYIGVGLALQTVYNAQKYDYNNKISSFVLHVARPIAMGTPSTELQSDRETVLAAVAYDRSFFRYASPAYRDDRDFVFVAVRTNADALKFASDALRDDPEFVLALVAHKPEALQYTSSRLKGGDLALYVQDILAYQQFVFARRNEKQNLAGAGVWSQEVLMKEIHAYMNMDYQEKIY